MLLCYAQGWLADMLRPYPSAPPPSYLAMCDTTNPAGARLYTHLKIGAGDIESACGQAARYTSEDLNALTGVSQELLIKLNAARAAWSLAQYLKPITARPDEVPGARESFEMLEMLKLGERIFGFYETQAAGLVAAQAANPSMLITANVVSYAQRLFPLAGLARNGPWVVPGGGNGAS